MLALLANDQDYGDNGKIGYSIVGENNYFMVHSDKGLLSIKKELDREMNAMHKSVKFTAVG